MLYSKFVLLALVSCVSGCSNDDCKPLARTEAGWVRGTMRVAQNGAPYASFRGIPYAKQPLAELRFQELQPTEPWEGILNTTAEGPVCYQHNLLFGPLMTPQGVSESCIHANVHVPSHALPTPGQEDHATRGLPIVVFMHGGGWMCGSGDADINGPEYLVGKNVIVITFNYRLEVLGFLSLATSKIPGNNGLRDAVILLRWVQRNARYFGGDPDEVTLSGQSAGSVNAHLLSLSPVSKGLFKRVWLMSGTANPNLYTTSPAYARQISNAFLTILGLNGMDYDTVHDQLIHMPIEVLYNASSLLTSQSLFTFLPVQEFMLPGVTAIIADDPETLLANGNGDDIPMVVGFTSNECQSLSPRLAQADALRQYKENPITVVNFHLLYTFPENVTTKVATKIGERYFGKDPTMDKYIKLCSDSNFAYPALKFVRDRAMRGGAPVFLYKFSYEAEHSVIKQLLNLEFSGAAHIEDMNNIFKVNSHPVPDSAVDVDMKDWMSDLFVNFVQTGAPSRDNSWPPQTTSELQYQELYTPRRYQNSKLSAYDRDMLQFFDNLQVTS